MPKLFRPRVVFQPESYQGIQQGINQLADAIRPTLGPLPRMVAVERSLRHRSPDMLDDGGTIAQRLIELPDRTADVGAMFLRHVLQHVRDQCGDGTATAAVLLQSIYNQGGRYIAAGGNPMKLRNHLRSGSWAILTELKQMTIQVKGKQQLSRIAQAICHDPPLARRLGEIFDIIGEYGRLEIRVGDSRELEREYVEGMYWPSELFSREMITDHQKLRTRLSDVAILLSNLDIDRAEQLIPVIEVAKKAGMPSLLIIAHKLSNEAISLLLANSKTDKFQAIAVKAPGLGHTKQGEALQDLVKITGGRLYLKAFGETGFDSIRLSDLGIARRAWADLENFGIIGGRGEAKALRQHIAELRTAMRRASNMEQHQSLQERIGKLLGGSAILKIGGATNAEIKARKESAERTADAVRGAMIEGVVPGGGVALLACRPKLQQMLEQSSDTDERAAYTILLRALEEPARTIAANAGYEPSQMMAQIHRAEPGWGFDIHSGQVVDMMEAGIFDSVKMLTVAVQSAIGSAALALTTDVLVHHKNPKPPAEAGPGDNWHRSSSST